MKRLVYLSAVRWADFAQRPHKFVEWHHAQYGSKVLWVEPYPTRLPQVADLRRPGMPSVRQETPEWLEVCGIGALPIEPLPGSPLVNGLLWRNALGRVAEFAAHGGCELAIGKPSRFALEALRLGCFARTLYDAMDDFPSFYRGFSAASMRRVEWRVSRRVSLVLASSTNLLRKFADRGVPVALARNACDPEALPAVEHALAAREPGLVGYVGTLGPWFDWELVAALARAHPQRRFVLIGPLHTGPGFALPPNVEIRPPLSHTDAMREMATFAVGLIPFRFNALTAGVDPVKYYEYRALGIPVLSTAFGEMVAHASKDPGVFLASQAAEAAGMLGEIFDAVADLGWAGEFRAQNTWNSRFGHALGAAAVAAPATAVNLKEEFLAKGAVQFR